MDPGVLLYHALQRYFEGPTSRLLEPTNTSVYDECRGEGNKDCRSNGDNAHSAKPLPAIKTKGVVVLKLLLGIYKTADTDKKVRWYQSSQSLA